MMPGIRSILVGLVLLSSCAFADVPLVQDGKSNAVIVLPAGDGHRVPFASEKLTVPVKPWSGKNAYDYLKTAAEDLQYHLEEMTGAKLEIASEAKFGQKAIVLDRAAIAQGAKPPKSESGQGFHILTKNGKVLIAGEGPEGTAQGIYTFLRSLGCDWVMPGKIGEIIPKQKTLTVRETNQTEVPSFFHREIWYRGSSKVNTPQDLQEMETWSRRQRLSPIIRPSILGGGHVWHSLPAMYREQFKKKPEMLALIRKPDGTLVRSGPQIESTDPDVVKLMADSIRTRIKEAGLPKNAAVSFAVGPADGLGFSISAESQLAGAGRMDPVMGDPDTTDLVVLFANQVLKELGNEYPNVTLGFYSYSTHEDYPMRYEPDPRINIIFAPINFSRFHSVFDSNSKTRPYYKNVVERWGEQHRRKGNKLAYYAYNWNLAENMLPYSKLRIDGEELPWYYKNGVRYIIVEATKAWSINAAHDYLMARKTWNVDLPWKDVLREYCEKSYGAGAKKMEEYFLKLTERQHGAGQEAGSYFAFHLIYDQDFVAAGKKLLEEAETAAVEPEQKERIQFVGMGLEALRLYLDYFDAASKFDFVETQRCYDAMIAHWEHSYAVNTQLVATEGRGYLKSLVFPFVQEGLKYSTGEYRMVEPLPDELKTMLDPCNTGEKMNFQSPDLNDSLYVRTRTWSAPWDAQGLGSYRTGAVWYRHEFELKNGEKGAPLGLFIGGVEDSVKVWLNGKLVGSSGVRFSYPFVFDLTDHVRADGKNVLVMKVARDSAANEIGLGGILRPSFLFTGPRLEKAAPEPPPEVRVLPGGERG